MLVAEDEETNFKLLENILIPTKAKIIHVITGKDAVEYSVGNNIDLILMDIKLPELDGFEATKQIKAQKDIPIIAITAYAADEDREKAINAGCDKFISKPISSKKLKNQIFFIFNPAEK
ncbi:MAG: response regulator [Bacteroidales bacterium]|nr:response regulator [Bacteroidales bacterium]